MLVRRAVFIFTILPTASYLVAYLSTFIDNFQKANQHIYSVHVTNLDPNIVCGRGCETMKFVYVALYFSYQKLN